jgi:hypothetical protein
MIEKEINTIAEYHLAQTIKVKINLELNVNQALSLAELIRLGLTSLELNEEATLGFEELAQDLEDEALTVYPNIEPYLGNVTILKMEEFDE